MHVVIILLLMGSSFSEDPCQSICLRKLGQSGCAKGSWCKKSYDCHGLFWTDDSRSNICSLDSDSSCSEAIPVLCSELEDGVPIDSTDSTPRTSPTPAHAEEIRVSPLPSGPIRHPVPVGHTIGVVSGDSAEAQDIRPRVLVRFDRENTVRLIPFLFDTGSVKSYVRPLTSNDDYRKYSGDIELAAPGFVFGFRTEFSSSASRVAKYGALGAARKSDFSKSASRFTFIPQLTTKQTSSKATGLLIIGKEGDEFSRSRCETEFSVLPLMHPRSHWIVDGAASLLGEGPTGEPARFLIDTGSERIFVPPVVLKALENSLQRSKIDFVRTSDKSQPIRMYDCDSFKARLPHLEFTLGSVSVSVGPDDYIIPSPRSDKECEINVFAKGFESDASDLYQLGMPVLRKLVTIFDAEHKQIAFCRIKSA